MIDEADEFVTGPQTKKRGAGGDLGAGVSVKRRRSMSPLLRRSQTPLGSSNHVGLGRSPAGGLGQQSTFEDSQQRTGEGAQILLVSTIGAFQMTFVELSTIWTQERIVTTWSPRATEG